MIQPHNTIPLKNRKRSRHILAFFNALITSCKFLFFANTLCNKESKNSIYSTSI